MNVEGRALPKKPERKAVEGLVCTVLGMACAMAFQVGTEGYTGLSAPPAASVSLLWTALGAALALLFWRARRLRPRWAWGSLCLGLLFGVSNYLGTTLFAYDTWGFLRNPAQLCLAALRVVGQGLPMAAAAALLDHSVRMGLWSRRTRVEKGEGKWVSSRLPAFCRARPTLCFALFFGLCWLPYLLVFFPGTLSWDMGEMLAQFFGLRPMDTWHPVFTTWLLGACVSLGRLLANDNLGVLLFMLLQTAALALALGLAVSRIRAMGAARWVQWAALAFFGLAPIWGSYAQFVCKDTLYTAAVLVLTLQVITALRGPALMKRRDLLLLAGSALLCCLLRSNGVYVALPTAVLVTALGAKGRQRLRIGGALGAALALALGFSSLLLPALGIRDEQASGLYSVCFQQSARVLRDRQVTPEEWAAIDRVLDAKRLPELYEPWISDPVKYTFRQYGQGAPAERAALEPYLRDWLAMMGKYPLTYAEAFVAGNSAYYAFLPKLEGKTYNNQAGNRFVFEMHPQIAANLNVQASYAMPESLRRFAAMAIRGLRHVPGLSVLYICAAYTWTLAAAAFSMGRQRRWRGLTAFAPAALSFAVCLLSPVNDYFRYFLPVAAAALPLLAWTGNPGGTPCRRAAICRASGGEAEWAG
ncbi:MAG: DUF6020 family protein [Clostridia bacterium]|nr:DUF6020 family protein [Clostridia bacterium]